jgi:PAS domain S-box-containing protein
MINIVFIGGKHNQRIKILRSVSNSKLHIVNTIKLIPEIVIDLFVVDNTYKYIDYNTCSILKKNSKLKHIPIISLIKKSDNIDETNVSDIIVSNLVSDAEFKNYVNTMIKMKLMDDELKKEKIILELKVKERTLEHQNKASRLNITLNSIGDGVIVTDSKGRIELINPTVQTLCDIKDNEYLNKKIRSVFKFFINDNEVDLFKIVKNTQEKFCLPIDSMLVTKNKKIRISDSASPIFDADGNFNGVVIVFHDITDDYEMRQNLINSEKKYKRIYENVPDIIYTYDMNGFITSINKNINILGYTKNEVLGKNISMLVTHESYEISKKEIEIKKPSKKPNSETINISIIIISIIFVTEYFDIKYFADLYIASNASLDLT